MTLDAKLILAVGVTLVVVALLASFAYDAYRADKKARGNA